MRRGTCDAMPQARCRNPTSAALCSNSTAVHRTTLTVLCCTALHYVTLHYCTTLYCTVLYYTTLYYCTTLYYTVLRV
eukprot:9473806-Pyramimonas_sp.AAC.1